MRLVLETRTGFVQSSGVRLYYEETGLGSPVILVHAGIADCGIWNDQIPDFSRTFQVIRYDMRGFGASDRATGEYSNIDDLLAVMRFLKVDKAHLIGLSYGARVAIDFALEHAEKVAGLVLASPNLSGYEFSKELSSKIQAVDEMVAEGNSRGAIKLELQMWVDGPFRSPGRVDSTVRERVRKMEERIYAVYNPDASPVPPRRPAISLLPEIQVPTLIIVGEKDMPDILAIGRLLQKEVMGARLTVVANAAHMLNMENPSEFNRLVLGFLRRMS
jgi:pimeloyl-ACP methyl ester carboxylesterase